MPVEGLTRKAIRRSIGRNLQGEGFIVSSTTRAGGDANSLIDRNRLWGGDDNHNGKWVYATSGDNDGEIRRISDYTAGTAGTDAAGSHDATLATGFSNTVPISMEYELWSPEYYPGNVDDAINQAINEVMGRYYKREESVALHGDRRTTRFDLPTEFQMVSRVEYRTSVSSVIIHRCEATFDETTQANWTQSLDTEKFWLGQSLKLVVADGAAAGEVITDSISSVDLSYMTHIEGWIRSSVALTAADYKIHLDNATVQGDGTDLESLSLPAVTADTDTFFRIALANPESDTAIISIGIEMDQDKGAHTVWFDDIKAVNENTSVWTPLPSHLWHIDQEANDLILTGPGKSAVGYSLIKLTGGSHPAQMTADTDTATVPEDYLVAKATSLMMLGGSRAGSDDPEGRRASAQYWEREAIKARGKFPALQGARIV